MDTLDRERLTELYVDRDEAAMPPAADLRGLSQTQAYWQGRIDEYAAQNAITNSELRLCEASAKE